MKLFVQVLAAGLIATPALAQSAGEAIRLGDSALSCTDIATEANAAAGVIGSVPAGGAFASEQVVGAATGLAMQGALMSGAGRSIPGIGMAGNLLGSAMRAQREQQEAQKQVARLRWHYLNGLYVGRNCAQQAASSSKTNAAPVVSAPK